VDCDAVTNAPDIFRLSGDLLTNLLAHADNLLAAEVHQANPDGSDVVFGCSVGLVRALVSETKLRVGRSGSVATISWDGTGFTLEQATNNLGTFNSWVDVSGPIKTSPYLVTNPPVTTFYRLRN
jgi:ABC-type sugar transport system substrate-binding protein